MNYQKNFLNFYDRLNTNQKKAVDIIDGPVLVLAGPGTGKTQVLTMRIANILTKTDTDPSAILALTFTESGVTAMKNRLIEIIGETAYKVDIFTFHGFATNVIQTHPDEFVFSEEAKPLSDLERVKIFREIFDGFNDPVLRPANAPYYYVRTVIDTIKKLKQESITPEQYLKYIVAKDSGLEKIDVQKNERFAYIYQKYIEKLNELGRYDFEDMINFVIKKFKANPDMLLKYQERYQYFLVDEFQDTNNSQAQIIYLLADYEEWQGNPNLFIVGDDDQSIYRFQGASAENITTFISKYPTASIINLVENYRSTQLILDSASKLIQNNNDRISDKLKISKELISQTKKAKEKIDYGIFTNTYIESYFIVNKIKQLIASGTDPEEIAVIYRNNNESVIIADYLSKLGIKYRIAGGDNILNNGLIIRLLNLLYAINNIADKNDDDYFFNVINYEFCKFNTLDILKFCRFASDLKINLFEALDHADLPKAKIDTINIIRDFRNKIASWRSISYNKTFSEFMHIVLDESGFITWILDQNDSYRKLNVLNSFLREIKNANITNPNLSLSEFLQNIELMQNFGISLQEDELELGKGSINLMTAHKSKGLEFEHVFIPYFTENKWSNKPIRTLLKLPKNIMTTLKSLDLKEYKNHDVNDERRLFYVALTRAKQKLYITLSSEEMLGTSNKQALPSIFISEGLHDYLNILDINDIEKDASEYLKLSTSNIKQDSETQKSADESEFIKKRLKQFKLSATTFNRYNQCPYLFKLEFLFSTPRQIEKHFVLGQLIHKVLENSNKTKDTAITLEDLLTDFNNQLKKTALNEITTRDLQIEGVEIIKLYYQTYQSEFTDNRPDIISTEKSFGKFKQPIKFYDAIIDGRIDKIVALNMAARAVQIVDYKTGRPKSLNEIKGLTATSDNSVYNQMLFYLLLSEYDRDFYYKIDSVMVDYVGNLKEKPKRILLPNNPQMQRDYSQFKVTVKNVWEQIQAQKFNRTTNTKICDKCRFKAHCWPDGVPVKSRKVE